MKKENYGLVTLNENLIPKSFLNYYDGIRNILSKLSPNIEDDLLKEYTIKLLISAETYQKHTNELKSLNSNGLTRPLKSFFNSMVDYVENYNKLSDFEKTLIHNNLLLKKITDDSFQNTRTNIFMSQEEFSNWLIVLSQSIDNFPKKTDIKQTIRNNFNKVIVEAYEVLSKQPASIKEDSLKEISGPYHNYFFSILLLLELNPNDNWLKSSINKKNYS
jgi:hypothetical protein